MDRDERLTYYRIETASQVVGIPPSTIRYYVRVGLVRTRREGREELLDEQEIARLRRIRRLREDLGINTAGVEVVMRLLDELESLRARLAESR